MVIHMGKKSAKLHVWSIIACVGSVPQQFNLRKIWNKYKYLVNVKSFHLVIAGIEQQTLSIP